MKRKRVQMLVMDVDGTLTDGSVYIGPQGEVFKRFNIKDGYGICNILPQCHLTPVIITGRTSDIVVYRAGELHIEHLYQGVQDKLICLESIAKKLNVSWSEIACIGDDLNDLPMMKKCGLNGCPSDAARQVIDHCDYVCKAKGGQGAVREFIEWLIQETPISHEINRVHEEI